MAEYKKNKCKKLVVMGCLVQRYYEDLPSLLPEVDLWIPISDYNEIWKKIQNLLKFDLIEKSEYEKIEKILQIKQLPMFSKQEYCEREISTGQDYAYLKIGEGCSNFCTYCAIPYIRGSFVSRKKEDIIDEAKLLAKKGIKELIIIAQDTTKYGIDIYGESKLAELLQELCKIEEFKWIRFLYSYPEGITDELIKVVKENDKICSYFDIPIQHISNSVLKRMNRKTTKQQIEKLIEKIRKEIPDATLRTSIIVGFPGETKKDFEELQEFVQKIQFDKLGVFMYSKEENTPAEKLPNQIHHATKKSRYGKIMEMQQKISNEKLAKKIGKEEEVLIEDISFDRKYYIGRTKHDVPDIDGIVYIENQEKDIKNLHTFRKIKIEKQDNYDLIGKLI